MDSVKTVKQRDKALIPPRNSKRIRKPKSIWEPEGMLRVVKRVKRLKQKRGSPLPSLLPEDIALRQQLRRQQLEAMIEVFPFETDPNESFPNMVLLDRNSLFTQRDGESSPLSRLDGLQPSAQLDKVPGSVRLDGVFSSTQKDFFTPSTRLESDPPSIRLDLVPPSTRNDVVPSSTEPDIVPSSTELDVVPSSIELDAVPSSTELDVVPPSTELDVVPSSTGLDVVLPSIQLEIVPLTTRPDGVPTSIRLDGVQSSIRLDGIQSPNRLDGLGVTKQTVHFHNKQPKKFTEKIREEASILQRMSELQREGLWYERRLPKSHEPSRIKAHWDYLLEEMHWLAADFQQERKWKRKAAQKCAKMVHRSFQEKSLKLERAEKEEEQKIKKRAGYIAKEVRNFWSNVQKLVEYQEQSKIEELRKKAMDQHLSFIVDQTEKISSMLAQSFNNPLVQNGDQNSTLADLNSEVSIVLSDDEFQPNMDEEDDDEETISKAEGDAKDVRAEIELLKKESGMSLEDVLDDLPPEYIQEKIAISSNPLKSSKDEAGKVQVEVDDEDLYVPRDSDSDAEETIEAEERLEENNPNNYAKELQELDDDNKLSVEELMAKYSNHKEEEPNSEDESCSTMSETDEPLMESESRDGQSVSETNEDSEMMEDRATPDENEEQNVGLASLLQTFAPETAGDVKAGEDDALNSVAALAQSFQPKGYTLSSTKVVTEVPSLLKYTLREYQHIGLDWLVTMYEKKLNGILADEMGLGKTIQTIALLAHLACVEGNWGPHLIVVPTSVMLNWEMEFKKWCPGFKILTYYGSQKERKLKRQGWTKPNTFHVCITSYKMVVQDHFSFRRRRWKYLVLDEAQNIKNFKSQRWQLLLNFSTHRRLLLTGTPLQNNLMELWSLMHFLMPNVFQSHREFREWFSNPVTGMVEGNTEYNQNIIRRLHKVLRPFILRRLKCEVEKQLPKKFEHLVMCRLSKRQRQLYEDFMSRSRTKETLSSGNLLSVMNVLMQLRKVCNHPNLFEARPINSPLQTEGISHLIPSLVWNMMDSVPLEASSSNLFQLTDADFKLSNWSVFQIKALRPPKSIIKIRDNATMEQIFIRNNPPRVNESYRPYQVIHSCRKKPILMRDIFQRDQVCVPPCPRLRHPVPMFMMNVDPRNFFDDEEFLNALGVGAPKRPKPSNSGKPKGRLISYNYDTKKAVRIRSKDTAPFLNNISKLSTGPMEVVRSNAGGHQIFIPGSRLTGNNLLPATADPPHKPFSHVSDVSASPLAYSSLTFNCTTIPNVSPTPTHISDNDHVETQLKPKDNVGIQSAIISGERTETVTSLTTKQPSILAEVKKLNELDTTVSRKTVNALVGEFEFSGEVSPFDEIQLEMEEDDSQKRSLKRRSETDKSELIDTRSYEKKKFKKGKVDFDSEYEPEPDDDEDDDDDDEDDYIPKGFGLKQRTAEEKARFLARKNVKTNRTSDGIDRKRSIDARASFDFSSLPKRKTDGKPDTASSNMWIRVHGFNQQDFDLDDVEIRKLKDRKAVIERMQQTNDSRCELHPVYGEDTIQMCRIFDVPSIKFSRGKHPHQEKDFINEYYFKQGFSEVSSIIEQRKIMGSCDNYINMAQLFWRHTNCFEKLIWTVEDIMKSLDEVLKRFVIFTPPVSAPLIQKRIFRPSSSRSSTEFKNEMEMRHLLKEPTKLLHPIISSMATQFPDSRLIQYDCGKLQVLDNLLRRLKSQNHRVLIFTQMAKMLDVLEIFLNYHGYIYLRLDGSTKIDQRQLLMDKFNTDKRIFCFILSTRSGGIGVNLTGADTVIFYDSDWNPTMDAQAQDRCHRIGQTRDVNIFRLVSEKTVEENILKKSNQKKLLGELAIEGGKFTTAYFKSHTIRELFDVNQVEADAQKRMSEVLTSRTVRQSIESPSASTSDTPTVDAVSSKAAVIAFESALTAAEDDTDVHAARTVRAENAAELAEFDETIPLDHLKEVQLDEPSKIAQTMTLILQELNSVERYAIRFMEFTIDDWSRETYASAQKEFEQQKKIWEIERVKRLEEEDLEKTLDKKKIDNDEPSDEEEVLSFYTSDGNNQIWYAQGSDELMPVWDPPTPPQDESDVYIDVCHDYLYSRAIIPESQLPPPYIPPKKKQLSAPSSPVKPVTPGTPSSSSVSSVSFTLEKGFEAPTSVELIRKLPIKVHRREEPIFAPRSLFDRPSPALAKLRRDYRLQKYNCRPLGSVTSVTKTTLGPGSITFPVVQPVTAKAAAPPPPITHPEIEWMITEDYTILQSMTSLLELPLSLMVVNLAQTPNWDMTSQIVNLGSRSYRSQKQCRLRYENVIEPREEGKLLFEPQLKKKKAKTFIKISPPSPQRAASLLKTSQLLAQDNYSEFSKVLMGRFDSIKAISAKRNPVSKPMTLNPHMKSNKQSLIFIEHGINFDVPVPAITIAQARYERLLLERRKLMAAQEAARAHAIACVAAGGLVSGSNMIPTVGLPMPVQQVVSGNVTPPNGSIVSVCGTPVTGISPILSLSPGISATSASEAVAAQKARLAAAASSNLSMANSLSSSPGTGIQSQMQNLSTPTGNLLPLVLSPTTSSAITELIGRGVLTAGAVPTTNSPPKRQYTLQHHHSQLQQQLQLLQHHQMQQKQQQIQLAISQVPQSPNQQIRQQQITSLSPATIVTTNSASTSQPLVQLIQTTPTQRGPTKQVFITQTPQSQSQTVQLPQQQQIQLQSHQIQIQQHIQQVHAQQQKQMQAQQQPQTQTMVVPSMSQDYTVVTSGVTGESFATTLTPQGMTTVTRLQPSLLQPIPRTITSLADLVSGGSQKTPISVSSAMSSGSIVSQNLPTQFSITPNTTMPAMIPRPVLGQGQPITTSPSVSKPRLSTKPVRQPTPAGTSINLPMVSSASLMQQQQQRERPAMQQLKRYQVISTGQSNVQGGMNILCASTNASSPTSLTFLTTPMDPSNPTSTASTSQRVSIVPTSVVGSVGSIVTPSSTRLQLVKQQTVGGRTVTRAISDAEMAALFKHGLSPQTRVVTSTGQVQNQITTSSSPIQLTGSPLTPAAAQLVNLQDSQRIQPNPTGVSAVGSPLQQSRQLSSQMISIGAMATPSKLNTPTQGPTTLIYTPSSAKVSGTIVPTSVPQSVTKFTPAQLQNIKQSYFRQHNQIVMSATSQSSEQPGLQQQQLKRIQILTNSNQPSMVGSSNSNVPINMGSVIITSTTSSSFPMVQSQQSTHVTSAMTTPIVSSQKMSIVQTGPVMTMTPSSSIGNVVNPTNPRPHLQLVKQQSIGGKTITRPISDLEVAEILKQHVLNPQARLSVPAGSIQAQAKQPEIPTTFQQIPGVATFHPITRVPPFQPFTTDYIRQVSAAGLQGQPVAIRLQPSSSGPGTPVPIPITIGGIGTEMGISVPGSESISQTNAPVTNTTTVMMISEDVGAGTPSLRLSPSQTISDATSTTANILPSVTSTSQSSTLPQ